ncbi:MAG TPA: TonB-dependent receptor [Longimicrobiales bacterium]|nr:TonB-dependent receptor [Longimicrobiales bacterium]
MNTASISRYIRPVYAAALGVLLAATLMPAAASAQAAGAIVGRVLEFTSDSAIADVSVELLDSRQRRVATTTSDATGAFRFLRVRAGTYQLRAASIGYREVLTPEVQVADDAVEVIVRMGIDAVPLAPLEVVGRPARLHANLAISDFLERAERKMGGAYILREAIEERQPERVSDLLRTVGSITVVNHARGGAIHNSRTQCAPSVWIDGIEVSLRFPNAWEAINSLHWSEVQGMEVYPGSASVPAQFSGSRSGCGVIAIWTRR